MASPTVVEVERVYLAIRNAQDAGVIGRMETLISESGLLCCWCVQRLGWPFPAWLSSGMCSACHAAWRARVLRRDQVVKVDVA